MKTQAAMASAAIKKELKAAGFKASVKSSNFSMGNSVDIRVEDVTPLQLKQIEGICGKYQYGSFNGMEDLYEYTNRRDDIPQAKYVHVQVDYSDGMTELAYQYIKGEYAGMEDAPDFYDQAGNHYNQNFQERSTTLVYRLLRNDQKFWDLVLELNEAA